MQGDIKTQEGENCWKARDILAAVFKLLRSFVIHIDPVLGFLVYGVRPCSGRFKRSRS
jgi:hypothetical protein